MANNKPNACIKVASKAKAGSSDRFYTEVGSVWIDPVAKSASVKLVPNVTISDGLLLMTMKDTPVPLAGRLSIVVTEVIGKDEKGKDKLKFHTVGSAFQTEKGNYSLVLPEGLSLVGGFYLYEEKEKTTK